MSIDSVDETGVYVSGAGDAVLDVCFDGRRVWSFWSQRDTERDGRNRLAAWPPALAERLDGLTRLTVVPHGVEQTLFDEEIGFGDSEERLAIVNAKGQPLGLDKANKLMPTFDTRSPAQTKALLDSLGVVIAELAEAGVAAFPAYGTLLGAIREGALIGHDSDADIGYVSSHDHPYDVIRESFDLQRRMVRLGYATSRYSGASFQVKVVESDGYVRGLDVFGGYLADGVLNLMGEVRTPFRKEWILPLGTCTLEGREFPAPAEPDRLLEAMYGPGWRVPDPAYKFETPTSTIRAFNNYFRVTRARRARWASTHRAQRVDVKKAPPSALARYVVEAEGVPVQLLDLGAGQAVDSLWFADQGSDVVAYDYINAVGRRAAARARRRKLRLELRTLNFQEWRSVLSEGARIVRRPGPRTLLANHTFDAMPRFGRESVGRFASMATRDGGRLYAEFWTTGSADAESEWTPVPVAEVVAILTRAGAHILLETEFDDPDHPGRSTGRVVAEWRRSSR